VTCLIAMMLGVLEGRSSVASLFMCDFFLFWASCVVQFGGFICRALRITLW